MGNQWQPGVAATMAELSKLYTSVFSLFAIFSPESFSGTNPAVSINIFAKNRDNNIYIYIYHSLSYLWAMGNGWSWPLRQRAGIS